MGVITISISDDAEKTLRKMASKNKRKIGNQIECLILKERDKE